MVSKAFQTAQALNSNFYAGNKIINGSFLVWQRGISSTSAGYVAADRWRSEFVGGTVTQSRQLFGLDVTLGVNTPPFYLSYAVTGQTLTTHYAALQQRIEDVRSYAGQTITILGWAARTSGSGNMSVEVEQNFGSGGSPSAFVSTVAGTVTLSPIITPFAITVDVPNIVGKTFGSDGNSSLRINFWISAGSTLDARSNSLGLQTMTLGLWGIHIVTGAVPASVTEQYIAPTAEEELQKCRRYYYSFSGNTAGGIGQKYASIASAFMFNAGGIHPVQMRTSPTGTVGYDQWTNANQTDVSHNWDATAFTLRTNALAAGPYRAFGGLIEFDAEL